VAACAQRALELGLAEICFTTHYDVDPARRDVEGWMAVDGQCLSSPLALDYYVAETLAVREAFAPRCLWVGLGLEIDYFPGVADWVAEPLARYPFDFVIGSVHCLDHRCLTAPEEAPACFAGWSVREMARRYFDLVAEAAATGLFDVIGHLDIYRRYGRAAYGHDVQTVHRGLAEAALQSMAHRGVGMEINTGALFKGEAEPYPGRELLVLAQAAGVRTLTFGSDAHHLADLGQGLTVALDCAVQAGFQAAHTFRRRQVFATISLVDAREPGIRREAQK